MSNFKALFIALALTITVQGINMLVPYPNIALENYKSNLTSISEIPISSSPLTGKSDNSKTLSKILESLDPESYLKSLPFNISLSDEKVIMNSFEKMSKAIFDKNNNKVDEEILLIESVLKKYWFDENTKEKYMVFEVFNNFFIDTDYKKLKSLESQILEMNSSNTRKELFTKMSNFVSQYYTSINNVLKLYKREMLDDKVIETSLINSSVIKKNNLLSKVDFDYETFLYGRAFEISNNDTNNLYIHYENFKASGKKQYISIIHNTLRPYWLKDDTLNSFLPIKTYQSTIYDFLKDEERNELNTIYKEVITQKNNKNVEKMLDQIILYNDTLRDSISNSYKGLIKSYDLNNIIFKKENSL